MEISDFKNSNILVVGLGLMGCAFADAFKGLNPKKIYGVDINSDIIKKAESIGLIDKGYISAEEVLPQCDFVFICLYLNDAINFIVNNMENFKEGSIITDIVGIKREIIDSVKDILRSDIDYIPGHPMAGKEKQGFGYADKSIFIGKNYILTPLENNKKENIDFLVEVLKEIGFSNIVFTTPDDHDKKIAFTSQLCHVIAASMVDINDDDSIANFEGGSFQDMTRIAIINGNMWSELFFANKDKLVDELNKFQDSIEKFKSIIEKEDEQLVDILDNIKNKREKLNR
ncbi:MAG: prephenate dehydrogenase [Eubacteriaceae bacterium]